MKDFKGRRRKQKGKKGEPAAKWCLLPATEVK